MSLLDYSVTPLTSGAPVPLNTYQGKVVLVVNTASYCGLTPHYAGLETLYQTYKDRGLVVLGFPSNEFGAQEPGTDADIAQFCSTKFEVSFPMFSKTTVTEGRANPFHAGLGKATGSWPQWNFHKYLINRDATQAKSFASTTAPNAPELIQAIEAWLG